jgi:pantoate--beta-alanine ligase
MRIIQNLDEMTETARGWLAGGTVGFVPTMGHLHAGHLSLVKAVQRECEISVVSIFVNPLQFDPGQDHAIYPRNLSGDLQLLDNEHVDIVFVPRFEDIYPPHFSTYVTPNGQITQWLKKINRLQYARGITTLTAILFQLVRPDSVYYSLKNALHVALVHQEIRDLNFDISLRTLPVVRDNDGLAISNRLPSLSAAEREALSLLYQALLAAQSMIEKGERDVATIEKAMADVAATSPLLKLDYATVCDPETFEQPGDTLATPLPNILIQVAGYVGNIYLVDNFLRMSDGYWLL